MFDGIARIEERLRRNQRAVARAVLAALIGLLAIAIALPAGGRFGVNAQTPTPTPTETETPTPTPTSTLPEGPNIEWVNPSEGSSTVLSTDQDVDQLYHLNTWVFQVPQDPHVEFEVESGNVRTALGPGERAGPDTWELFWDLSGLSDGTYTLRAFLFAGFTGPGSGTVVDTAEIEVQINNEGSSVGGIDPDDRAVAAEITYPENSGGLGYYTDANGTSRFVVEGVVSSRTRFVEVLYTGSIPGTEPTWTRCDIVSPEDEPPPGMALAPEGSKYVRTRCNVDEEIDPGSISGVALVPDRTPSPATVPAPEGTYRGAADGHRAISYAQVPTNVLIFPATHAVSPGEGGEFGCSENIFATVLDQEGRLITGANTDVHATGPTNNLKFGLNTGGGTGRSAAAPPSGGNHLEESGYNCSNGSAAGTQGYHPVAGANDVKHIQTAPAGTDRHGRFVFALRSNAPGSTQFSVWADTDNNDVFCAEEAHGDGSIGWGQFAPEPTGVEPDTQGPCPAGQQSPTPTASPSPTPGDTVESGPCEGHPRNSRTPREDADGFVIVGDDGDNMLEGSDGDDLICGLGGHDKIVGKAGNDELHGDNGQDDVRGHAGQDLVFGGNGHDTVYGNKGHDTLRGNRHNDVLRGGHHNDDVIGGRGHDVLRGGRRHDTLRGSRGNDELYGNRGNDLLNGGPGWDTCRGGGGADDGSNCET